MEEENTTSETDEESSPVTKEPLHSSIEGSVQSAMETTAEKKKQPVRIPKVNPLGGKKKVEGLVALSVLAQRHKTSAVVLSALKAEYGWTDSTKITDERYRNALNGWLSAPAGQRRKQ